MGQNPPPRLYCAAAAEWAFVCCFLLEPRHKNGCKRRLTGLSVCSGAKLTFFLRPKRSPNNSSQPRHANPLVKTKKAIFLYRNLRKLGFRPHFDPFSHGNLGPRSARERKFEHFHRSCVGSFSLPTWQFKAINTPLQSDRRKGEDEREKGRRERGSLGRISSPKARCLRGQNWCRTIHGIDRGQTHQRKGAHRRRPRLQSTPQHGERAAARSAKKRPFLRQNRPIGL